MADRPPRPLAPSLTVPLGKGHVTVSRGVLRGKATLRFSSLELHGDIMELRDLVEVLAARINAMAKVDASTEGAQP